MSIRSEVKEMSCQLEVKSKRCHVNSSCARNAGFYNIETAVGGREGRRRKTAVAAMFAYVSMSAYVRLWSDRSTVGKCNCRLPNALSKKVLKNFRGMYEKNEVGCVREL